MRIEDRLNQLPQVEPIDQLFEQEASVSVAFTIRPDRRTLIIFSGEQEFEHEYDMPLVSEGATLRGDFDITKNANHTFTIIGQLEARKGKSFRQLKSVNSEQTSVQATLNGTGSTIWKAFEQALNTSTRLEETE